MDMLSSEYSLLMTVVGALFCVLLLMMVLAWCVRRSGLVGRLQRQGTDIHVVARVSLGARERLVLVEIGEQRLLLGVTPSHIACLDRTKAKVDV